jgi:hypothetical protein
MDTKVTIVNKQNTNLDREKKIKKILKQAVNKLLVSPQRADQSPGLQSTQHADTALN